ncbi:MAG: ferritin-like domain-containing protein [Candidatus Sericytochromatia bacterium]|nr:ferritin-like domain-containing protein [Candidatus Sericytochromatia bacterium]
MSTATADPKAFDILAEDAMQCLHRIYQAEMAGIIRYLHYSFMVMGHNRIPIQAWFRNQATESQTHAIIIGEKITSYGGHPPLLSQSVEETNQHGINAILEESLHHELQALQLYKSLADMAARDGDVALEELAREMVRGETEHIDEVRKMLRQPH